MSEEFKRKNRKDWAKAVGTLFPVSVPMSVRWTDRADIVRVISTVAKRNLNHTLFPARGGLDLTGAKASREQGCIELAVGSVAYVLRPGALTFHSISGQPSESYFRMESEPLAPSGVYPGLTGDHEELVEIAPAQYHDRSAWDEQNLGEDEDGIIPLPKGSRLVLRYFNGVFLIVAKGSVYNSITATYDGRHNKMSDSQFRGYIEHLVDKNRDWIEKIDQPAAA